MHVTTPIRAKVNSQYRKSKGIIIRGVADPLFLGSADPRVSAEIPAADPRDPRFRGSAEKTRQNRQNRKKNRKKTQTNDFFCRFLSIFLAVPRIRWIRGSPLFLGSA